ncbi:MAG: SPFH domain-containing protein [Firmicutes bacterium]|nr:SPFH domain-containing protein [Bacillota bacterium]MCL1953330.1 SPFH domain-containing protein [Bacillota bacterium]
MGIFRVEYDGKPSVNVAKVYVVDNNREKKIDVFTRGEFDIVLTIDDSKNILVYDRTSKPKNMLRHKKVKKHEVYKYTYINTGTVVSDEWVMDNPIVLKKLSPSFDCFIKPNGKLSFEVFDSLKFLQTVVQGSAEYNVGELKNLVVPIVLKRFEAHFVAFCDDKCLVLSTIDQYKQDIVNTFKEKLRQTLSKFGLSLIAFDVEKFEIARKFNNDQIQQSFSIVDQIAFVDSLNRNDIKINLNGDYDFKVINHNDINNVLRANALSANIDNVKNTVHDKIQNLVVQFLPKWCQKGIFGDKLVDFKNDVELLFLHYANREFNKIGIEFDNFSISNFDVQLQPIEAPIDYSYSDSIEYLVQFNDTVEHKDVQVKVASNYKFCISDYYLLNEVLLESGFVAIEDDFEGVKNLLQDKLIDYLQYFMPQWRHNGVQIDELNGFNQCIAKLFLEYANSQLMEIGVELKEFDIYKLDLSVVDIQEIVSTKQNEVVQLTWSSGKSNFADDYTGKITTICANGGMEVEILDNYIGDENYQQYINDIILPKIIYRFDIHFIEYVIINQLSVVNLDGVRRFLIDSFLLSINKYLKKFGVKILEFNVEKFPIDMTIIQKFNRDKDRKNGIDTEKDCENPNNTTTQSDSTEEVASKDSKDGNAFKQNFSSYTFYGNN